MKTFLRNQWEGLRNGLVPMLGKEMRGRTRGLRSPLLLSFFLGLMSAGTLAFLWLMTDRTSQIMPQVGLNLYSLLVLGMILLLAFIAPAIAAGAISGERERRTYDLLLVTRASLTGIVLGKWLASVAYLLFLVLAALPVLAVVFLFGGVPLTNMGMALVVALTTGLGYGALGLALSAILRRSQAATIVSLVLVFMLVFGSLVVAGVVSAGRQPAGDMPVPAGEPWQSVPGPPWYVYLSPLAALSPALPGMENEGLSMSGRIPLVGTLLNEIMRQFQTGPVFGTSAYGPGYPGVYPGAPVRAGLPSWARFALCQGILAVISLVVSVLVIAPRKPWSVWLASRRARARGQGGISL
ncbi:ABC-type transport system involved in multi-copper enzyme maturation permease subunit [Desulfofundulus luciae]|uniref:ABC-type transport system involved in multi-copper enzyme maturation permease subunit n=1 Tax=Desulfofundulus luciae TaxID=74702 RepID=A0ABU0B1X3_9FIRM|nr:ABC transporter permease subunit [Desulfofundulus luciae]MDQ0286722.1 ABC-type transport system involved in multi-copper enzyme maturation permease subunit [Desulfofundulus luciae]